MVNIYNYAVIAIIIKTNINLNLLVCNKSSSFPSVNHWEVGGQGLKALCIYIYIYICICVPRHAVSGCTVVLTESHMYVTVISVVDVCIHRVGNRKTTSEHVCVCVCAYNMHRVLPIPYFVSKIKKTHEYKYSYLFPWSILLLLFLPAYLPP